MTLSITYKRFLHAFTMTFIMIGMFCFYMISDFHIDMWKSDNTYYAFAKIVDILLILCILNPLREVWREWTCIGTFFAVRALWEILAVQDYSSANRPSIIFSLFCIDILCLISILIIKITKTRK